MNDKNKEKEIFELLKAIKQVRQVEAVFKTYHGEQLIAQYKKKAIELFRKNIETFIERA